MTIGLTLSLSGFSVSLVDSLSGEFPRLQPNIGTTNYTAYGSVYGDGTLYEPPHVWTCNFLVTEAEYDTLKIIFAEHLRIKRTNMGTNDPAGIVIDDYTDRYVEKMPRSREIVSGTTEIQVPTVSPTQTMYFARFKAHLQSGWKAGKGYYSTDRRDISFTLIESSKLVYAAP